MFNLNQSQWLQEQASLPFLLFLLMYEKTAICSYLYLRPDMQHLRRSLCLACDCKCGRLWDRFPLEEFNIFIFLAKVKVEFRH